MLVFCKCIYNNILCVLLVAMRCWDLLFLVIIGICWYGKGAIHNLSGWLLVVISLSLEP